MPVVLGVKGRMSDPRELRNELNVKLSRFLSYEEDNRWKIVDE